MRSFSTTLQITLFVPLLLLMSCSEKNKKPLEGKRYSVLESEIMLRSDLEPGSIDVSLPTAEAVTAWPQPDFGPNHLIPHAKQALKGTIAWQESIGAGNSASRAIFSPPVSDGINVYTIDARGQVQCRRLETGALVWSKDYTSNRPDPSLSAEKQQAIQDLQKNRAEIDYIGGGISLDAGNLFIAYSNGLIQQVNPETGAVLWFQKLPEIIRSSPLLHRDTLYLITTDNKIMALNKSTGTLLWTNFAREESLSFVGGASPAVTDQIVVAPFSSGEIYALYPLNGLEFWNDAAFSFKSLDSVSMIGQFMAHPVIHKDMVIVVSHADLSTMIDLRTGQRVWQKPFGGTQTPFVTDNFIFMITTSNDLICMTRGSGRIIWVHPLAMYANERKKRNRILWYGPVLTGERLMLVSSVGDIQFISPKDGQVLEADKSSKKFIFAPVLVKDKALLMSQDANLTVLQ